MMERILLCADEMCLRCPELLGLEDEQLDALAWLESVSDGVAARQLAASGGFAQVWVMGCDDVEPINLAAAIKKDQPALGVWLFSPKDTGSVATRATSAGIDGVWSAKDFLRAFAKQKEVQAEAWPLPIIGARRAQSQAAAPLVPSVGISPTMPAAAAVGKEPVASAMEAAQPHAVVPVVPAGSLQPCGHLGQVITVAGARGGVGKSCVSALMAQVAARCGLRVALVDGDLQFGDADVLLGVSECVRLDSLLDQGQPRKDTPAVPGRIDVLGAPEKMEYGELLRDVIPAEIARLRTTHDVVLVNGGSVWDDLQLRLFEISTTVVFLSDQRPGSVQALRHGLDLCSRCGIATAPFTFAVNRCGKEGVLASVDVSCALGVNVSWELSDGGKEVEEACGMGDIGTLCDSRNPFALSVARMFFGVYPGSSQLDKQVVDSLTAPVKKSLFGKFRKEGKS